MAFLGPSFSKFFSPKIDFKPEDFRKSWPPKSQIVLTYGGGRGATRADSSSRRLPLKFPPVGRSRRENHQEISTKNVWAKISGAPEKFRKRRPQKAKKNLTYTGGVGATRADSSSRRLPLEFSPVFRSRRGNHQEISTNNVWAKISGTRPFTHSSAGTPPRTGPFTHSSAGTQPHGRTSRVYAKQIFFDDLGCPPLSLPSLPPHVPSG